MKKKPTLVFDSRGRVYPEGDASELDPDAPPISFELPTSVATAVHEVSKARKFFRAGSVGLATDPATHPDSQIIREWVKDPREFDVLVWLAASVIREWEVLPHRTQAEHRELFQRIGRLCRELNAAIDETGDGYIRGGGFGLARVGVRDLMTDGEAAVFEKACNSSVETKNRSGTEHGHFEPGPDLPRVDQLLERVASAARRLEKDGPIHSQPAKRGAKRGYFIRRMGELFQQRHGEQPHEVIAALTTIALGEATDRELVAKLLAPRTL